MRATLRGLPQTVILATAYLLTGTVAAHAAAEPQREPLEQVLRKALDSAMVADRYSVDLNIVVTSTLQPPKAPTDSTANTTYSCELKVDGDRIDLSSDSQGVDKGELHPQFRTRCIWNNDRFIQRDQYLGKGLRQITASLSTERSSRQRLFTSSQMGFWLFQIPDGDDRPIAQSMLDDIKAVTLDPKTENVEGSECLVVTAKLPTGAYTLWLDPESNYIFRRARVVRSTGDLAYGQRLPWTFRDSTQTGTFSRFETEISKIRIGRAGRNVVIMGGVLVSKVFSDTDHYSVTESRCDRSNIQLEPQFDQKKVFIMNGIPNGTRVYWDNQKDHLAYIWQDGNVVLDTQHDAVKATDEAIEREKAAAQKKKG